MILKSSVKKDSSISITPLIDVVFILLLFFMLSSTFQKEKQIEMKTSSSSGKSSSKEDKSYKFLLDVDEVIYINGIKHQLNSEKFNAYLTKLIKNNAQITLAANPEIKTQKFIEVLDNLKNSGILNLNISKSELP